MILRMMSQMLLVEMVLIIFGFTLIKFGVHIVVAFTQTWVIPDIPISQMIHSATRSVGSSLMRIKKGGGFGGIYNGNFR
jgi:hypothetical protein